MKLFAKSCLLLLFGYFCSVKINAQACQGISPQHVADIPSTCGEMTMTMLHDQMGRNYLYVANKMGGLKIWNTAMPEMPAQAATVSFESLNELDVISLSQEGAYLYLALGNIFNDDQLSGMAIIDVNDPQNPVVADVWDSDNLFGGAGIVKVDGDYAYLGAMGNGLMVLDVSNKSNIVFLSQFVPDINFPDPNPDPLKYNARGMAVNDDLVYLCYDAGGLRIIDVSDKTNPVEVGRYANPELNGLPRAYNNIVLANNLAYLAIDYCGLEILDVSDPSQIDQVGWWNPWDCQSNPLNWFSSPGHTNEMAYNPDCKTIFLSTGKSDLYAVDISDPANPDSCFSYGGISNNIGTWGVSAFENNIFLSYVCALIPFVSNWTGVKILSYENNCVSDIKNEKKEIINVFPNPVNGILQIDFLKSDNCFLVVYNNLGRTVFSKKINTEFNGRIDFSNFKKGIYFLGIKVNGNFYSEKIIKM